MIGKNYQHFLKTSNDKNGSKNAELLPLEETKDPESEIVAQGNNKVDQTAAKQILKYKDYELSYSPKKNETIIRYVKDDDDYTIKIKKGVLSESDEYRLVENRLYLSEIDLMTPFVIHLSNGNQLFEIYDGEFPTGLSINIDNQKTVK